jgi:hypothetical protein
MSTLGFSLEKVDESTQHRLVIRIRPWYRWEYLFGVPGLWLTALIATYIGMNMLTYWRFLAYFAAFWMVAGSLVFAFDNAEDVVLTLDRDRGLLFFGEKNAACG